MAVFMSSNTQTQSRRYLVSIDLLDAYTDFMLSRQAMNCTPATLEFYKYTAGVFLAWIEKQGVTRPEEVTARYVRQYLSELIGSGKKDTTLHANARAIRTLVRFWHAEGYIPNLVKFEMPKLFKKRLPVLTADELQRVIKVCNVRDKALVLFMADSGLRRSETINLTWADVNMSNGLIRVKQGKGRKDRASVIGATTRRALLKYKRTIDHADHLPLFQSRTGERFTGTGVLLIFHRLSKKTGIHVTPHAMRRTFVALSLEAGMDVLHLQGLGGWESLHMVYHYAQMVDDDLLQAHMKYSPVDNLK
jgi:site-specific recombinase XerD